MRITIVNPGAMGESIAAAAVSAGSTVYWVSANRSQATRNRAARSGLEERQSLELALADSDAVVSVCPPHAALAVAEEVAKSGFEGLYVDGNAVSPETMRQMADRLSETSLHLVDGGIIGPPAWQEGSTRFYLSGGRAMEAKVLFDGSLVDARIVSDQIGAASALKMVYAAWTKGGDALLLAIRALASAEGVESALIEEWGISQAGTVARSEKAAAKNGAKAWRFEGEMHEIAATFAGAGLPSGFHQGAAEIYRRMAGYKDYAGEPSIDEVTTTLNQER